MAPSLSKLQAVSFHIVHVTIFVCEWWILLRKSPFLMCALSKIATQSASNPGSASKTDSRTDASAQSTSATLVDRLYTVPDSMRVGRGKDEEEGGEEEAHRRYQKELLKYRRTAKVEFSRRHAVLCMHTYVCVCVCVLPRVHLFRWCISWRKCTVGHLPAT